MCGSHTKLFDIHVGKKRFGNGVIKDQYVLMKNDSNSFGENSTYVRVFMKYSGAVIDARGVTNFCQASITGGIEIALPVHVTILFWIRLEANKIDFATRPPAALISTYSILSTGQRIIIKHGDSVVPGISLLSANCKRFDRFVPYMSLNSPCQTLSINAYNYPQ